MSDSPIKTSTQGRIWIDWPRLYIKHRKQISSNAWLTDEVINASQHLLRQQFPTATGLEDTILIAGQNSTVSGEADIVQIVHDRINQHWITITTIGCNANAVKIYCSLNYVPSEECIKVITDYIKFKNRTISLYIMNTERQNSVNDCGLYAIAYATSLLNGRDPINCVYDQQKMREHLIQCLEKDFCVREFPCTSQRTVRNTHITKKICTLNCVCFSAFCKEKDNDMIQCNYCRVWFHKDCIKMEEKQYKEYKLNKNKRFRCNDC